MIAPNMETYEARLVTFEKPQAGPKRRNSVTKGTKGSKWLHKSPGAMELARAGFYFKPTTSAPDNVQCFSCEKELDGWDAEDVAILEHRQLSPDCGFALNLGIEYDIENDCFEPKGTNPMKMLEARKATFNGKWPHEDKRGWTCKTQKMAEGGWYYCPTPENDDMVKCAYCGLSLDGWEPKDNPLNEHQRRAPDCIFFCFGLGKPVKASRAAKCRLSKASRMSIQSNATTHTIGDLLDSDESATNSMIITSTAAKPTKKAGAGRKPRNKVREAAKSESDKDHDIQDLEIGEPEDAGFDTVIPVPATKPKRGKKRLSNEMESLDQQNVGSQDAVSVPPPPKRRATRASSSTLRLEQVPLVDAAKVEQDDAVLIEKEGAATEQPVPSKKGLKGAPKRASSAIRKASNTPARKASNASSASKAVLQAICPTDEEVDAVLVADLDRPLTDEEIEQNLISESKAKIHRITQSKPASRNASRMVSASKAPIRRSTRPGIDLQEGDLRLDQSKGKQDDLEQAANASSQGASSLGVKSKKGWKVAKAANIKNLQKTQEAPVTISTGVGSEHLIPDPACSPTCSATMLHHDIAAKVSSHVLPMANSNDLSKMKDANRQVSGGSISRENSTSYDFIKEMEEKPSKTLKTKIKVEIQRPPCHIQQQIEPVQDDSIAFAADNESIELRDRAPPSKKHNIKKSKSKISKATAILSYPRQLSAEPVAEQETPLVSTDACANRNVQIYSPAIINNVDKEATQVGTTSSILHDKVNDSAPSASPQSSDAENHPPSTRPAEKRPPLAQLSPSKTKTTHVPLAASTPRTSPTKCSAAARIHSDAPWTGIDLETVFGTVNTPDQVLDLAVLSSPEKRMTVEEWVLHNAVQGEERLKMECEKMVGAFELESVKALRSLEGIACVD